MKRKGIAIAALLLLIILPLSGQEPASAVEFKQALQEQLEADLQLRMAVLMLKLMRIEELRPAA